jgi:hypothetical protein
MLVTVIVVVLLDPKMLTTLDGEEVIVKSWLDRTCTDTSVEA